MEQDIEYTPVERMLLRQAEARQMPFSGSFELTPYCNLSCRMCYVKDVRPGLKLLSGAQWLEIGRQAADAGVFGVVLTGGEPLLHPDFRMIYAGLRSMGLILTINTNGTLIDEDMADFLANNMPRRVNISIYGADRACYGALCGVEDAFDRMLRGISLLQERNVPVKINITPSTINFPQMPQILSLCRERKLPVQIAPYLFEPVRTSMQDEQRYRVSPQQMGAILALATRVGATQETWMKQKVLCFEALRLFDPQEKNDALQPIQCGAGVYGFWICWDGGMNLCAMITKPHVPVLGGGLLAAWEQIREASAAIRVPARCNTCSLSFLCNPCAAVSLHETGDCAKITPYLCRTAQSYAHLMAQGIQKKAPEAGKTDE